MAKGAKKPKVFCCCRSRLLHVSSSEQPSARELAERQVRASMGVRTGYSYQSLMKTDHAIRGIRSSRPDLVSSKGLPGTAIARSPA